MLEKISNAQLMELPKYDRIIIYLFRRLTKGMTRKSLPNDLQFTLDDVRTAMDAAVSDGIIDEEVRNAPDIKYTYDARRNLPEEVEQCGHMTWMQVKKGVYKFKKTKRPNLIALPGDVQAPDEETIVDQSPAWMRPLMGNDEQATFTLIRNARVLQDFLGFPATPIQGHHRTTVSYGQIEIDEVQAGIGKKNTPTIVPIAGKGGQDRLSWSQALNLNTYGAEKALIKNLTVRSLAIWRDPDDKIWIVEFSPETEIDKIKIVKAARYKFVMEI